MLNFNELVEQSSIAQYYFEQAYQEGFREGMLSVTQQVLKSRFELVPAGVLSALAHAKVEELDAMAPLLISGSLGQIREFLKVG